LQPNLEGRLASLLSGDRGFVFAENSEEHSMKSFLAGLGIGIGLGILFAPMSGEETRNNLQQRAGDLADSARDLVDQGKDRVRTTVSAIRGQAERSGNQVSTGTEGITRNL
jgi:gas vesicle protein